MAFKALREAAPDAHNQGSTMGQYPSPVCLANDSDTSATLMEAPQHGILILSRCRALPA